LIDNKSKQPDNSESYVWKNFSDGVKKLLKIKRMKQIDLEAVTNLSLTTISRICRNTNGRGGEYKADTDDFKEVCLGLELTHEEKDKLFKVTFPEIEFLDYFIDKRMSAASANLYIIDYKESLEK